MFKQTAFAQQNIAELYELIDSFSFGDLIITDTTGVHVHHLPFVLDTVNGCLYAHVAKGNSEWKSFLNAQNVLCVFKGENAYISPNWYASKQESHKVVPTWNYRIVHVRGTCVLHEDYEWLKKHLNELTNKHEYERSNPWSLSNAPEEFVKQLTNAIMGIEIKIDSIEGKWKLSQNKAVDDIEGVIRGLEGEPSEMAHQLALQMEKMLKLREG